MLQNDQREHVLEKLEDFFRDALALDVSGFELEELLDFIQSDIGPILQQSAYNQGVTDAMQLAAKRNEALVEDQTALLKI